MRCLLFLAVIAINAQASIYDYIYPNSDIPSFSNYGSIGLIQTPTARFHEEGTIAFSWTDVEPYLRGSIIAYPFSWFEASYQYADINNARYSNVFSFSKDQTYKDKSFDAKFRLLKERKYFPSLAVGARDLAGTGVFSSEYIVASKRFNNLDISLGMGWGILSRDGKKNPFSYLSDSFDGRTNLTETRGGEFNTGYFFSGDTALFGGAELNLPNLNGLRIKVEYDSTDYEEEGFPFGSNSFNLAFDSVEPSESKFNFGLMYPVNEVLQLKFSYVKGNLFSFGFSIQGNLGKKSPFFKKNDSYRPIPNAEVYKKVNARDDTYVYKTSLKFLAERELYLQNAVINDDTLEIVYNQSKYASFVRATGRVMQTMDEIAPEKIKNFKVSNLNGGMGMHTVSVSREDFSQYQDENLYKLASRETTVKSLNFNPDRYEFNPSTSYPAHFSKITPVLRSQIGGPDGFYFGDLRMAVISEIIFSPHLSFMSAASVGIINNFDELKLASDSVLQHVRTDIVKYLKATRDYSIARAHFNYFQNPINNLYYKFSAGIFESMFGGIGGEILYRPFNANWGIGAEVWRVQQRGYEQLLDFQEYKTTTGFINLNYKEPRTRILLQVKGGKFLAGDSGLMFDFSRKFPSGLSIGAFASKTDISLAEFGEGSFDKGFYFHMPVESFFDFYSKGTAGFGLRPITRDGAAILSHSHHLWGVTEQAQSGNITRDWEDLYD